MGKSVYILCVIMLFIILPLHSADRNNEHLAKLESLIDNNIAYDSIAPIDSVIIWCQELAPVLQKENRTELFFRTNELLVFLYSLRGDIGPAIDKAREMYEQAEAMNYSLGIALSSKAIGDGYYCSGMFREAIGAYTEAIYYPVDSSQKSFYKEMAMLRLISILLREGNLQEAEVYRDKLLKSEYIHTNKTLQFFAAIIDVFYYALKNDLDNIRDSFGKAEAIYQSDKQPFFKLFFYYTQGIYNEAIGAYETALQCYDLVLESIRRKMRSVDYLLVSYAKANLLVKTGDKKEAARIYEEISVVTDSVVAPSYAHRINRLRASFQENRMKVENKAEFNRIFMGGIIIGMLVLSVIIYLTLHILKQNRKIAASKKLLEQSRQKAENAVKTKSLLLSNMSHEIRTPLTALSGFSGLLTEQELDAETRRQCGEIIQQNSELLLKLINDVIDLSNLEVGNMKFKFDFYDAVVIGANVIDTVNRVKQTQAEVRFVTPLQSLKIYTDDARLQQLLINLLINATKFTPSGSIVLEIQQQSEDMALFSVTDTGCGIPLEQQGKIFNRFEKLNEGVQGTGLGLSICQLIIERIGGKIWIDSDYTGGCRFYFTHPIHPVGKGKEAQA